MRVRRLALFGLLLPAACGPATTDEAELRAGAVLADEVVVEDGEAGPGLCLPITINDQALILRDLPALAARNIHLRRVLTTLAQQTPDPTDSAETLYASMGASGFPTPGVALDAWYGVALVNRFDLADKEGTTCGEYRLIVSRPRQFMENSQFTFIFEASVANPRPELGRAGCRPLQAAWGQLSHEPDPVARAAALEAMYFTGVAGFPPVVHIDHYGAQGLGQVRGNFFLNADLGPWNLDEFALHYTTTADVGGRPRIWGATFVPRPVADVLGVNIFAAGPAVTRQVATLRAEFIAQLGSLAAAPVDIRYTVPESAQASADRAVVNPVGEAYVNLFAAAGGDTSTFGQEIAAGMAARGIRGITPTQMVRRAFTQSCGGCHDDARPDIGGGATWPKNSPDGRVFIVDPNGGISGALVAFLPERRARLQAFLACRS